MTSFPSMTTNGSFQPALFVLCVYELLSLLDTPSPKQSPSTILIYIPICTTLACSSVSSYLAISQAGAYHCSISSSLIPVTSVHLICLSQFTVNFIPCLTFVIAAIQLLIGLSLVLHFHITYTFPLNATFPCNQLQ